MDKFKEIAERLLADHSNPVSLESYLDTALKTGLITGVDSHINRGLQPRSFLDSQRCTEVRNLLRITLTADNPEERFAQAFNGLCGKITDIGVEEQFILEQFKPALTPQMYEAGLAIFLGKGNFSSAVRFCKIFGLESSPVKTAFLQSIWRKNTKHLKRDLVAFTEVGIDLAEELRPFCSGIERRIRAARTPEPDDLTLILGLMEGQPGIAEYISKEVKEMATSSKFSAHLDAIPEQSLSQPEIEAANNEAARIATDQALYFRIRHIKDFEPSQRLTEEVVKRLEAGLKNSSSALIHSFWDEINWDDLLDELMDKAGLEYAEGDDIVEITKEAIISLEDAGKMAWTQSLKKGWQKYRKVRSLENQDAPQIGWPKLEGNAHITELAFYFLSLQEQVQDLPPNTDKIKGIRAFLNENKDLFDPHFAESQAAVCCFENQQPRAGAMLMFANPSGKARSDFFARLSIRTDLEPYHTLSKQLLKSEDPPYVIPTTENTDSNQEGRSTQHKDQYENITSLDRDYLTEFVLIIAKHVPWIKEMTTAEIYELMHEHHLTPDEIGEMMKAGFEVNEFFNIMPDKKSEYLDNLKKKST